MDSEKQAPLDTPTYFGDTAEKDTHDDGVFDEDHEAEDGAHGHAGDDAHGDDADHHAAKHPGCWKLGCSLSVLALLLGVMLWIVLHAAGGATFFNR
jgi:ABC-type Zn2+ transport system substrate-binding protein/surface adhesin